MTFLQRRGTTPVKNQNSSSNNNNSNTSFNQIKNKLKPCTEQDRINTLSLEAFLSEQKLSDSPEVHALRLQVLTKLNIMIQSWVHDEVRKLNIPEAEVKTYQAEIISFGSFRLGVNSQTGDIDLLCICPKVVSRASFFTDLRSKIENHPDCREFKAAPDAFVPLLSFMFSGIEIDLIYAQINHPKLPDPFNIGDNNNLLRISQQDVRSLNGTRVTDKILNVIPDNIKPAFRATLRFLKLWAKKRGIYSNVFGFLGGVSWALLTAYTCQHQPSECASVLLRNFFKLFSQWQWPNPVHLCKPETGEHYYRNNAYLTPIWTPEKSPNDLFPIITPAFPCMNSTFNIQHITKNLLIDELKRGDEITAKLENKSGGPEMVREVLFQLIAEPNFFSSYQHFFDVTITTTTENEMNDWYNFVESKIRGFFNDLWSVNKTRGNDINTPPLTLRPWPYGVYNPTPSLFERHFYIGVQFHIPPQDTAKLDFQGPFQRFLESTTRLKLRTNNMKVDIKHIRAHQLPDWVFPGGIRPPAPLKRKQLAIAKDAAATAATITTVSAATTLTTVTTFAPPTTPLTEESLKPTLASSTTLSNDQNKSNGQPVVSNTKQPQQDETIEGRFVVKTANPTFSNQAQELVQLEPVPNLSPQYSANPTTSDIKDDTNQ